MQHIQIDAPCYRSQWTMLPWKVCLLVVGLFCLVGCEADEIILPEAPLEQNEQAAIYGTYNVFQIHEEAARAGTLSDSDIWHAAMLARSSVLVIPDNPVTGKLGSGSGSLIGPNHILTVRHNIHFQHNNIGPFTNCPNYIPLISFVPHFYGGAQNGSLQFARDEAHPNDVLIPEFYLNNRLRSTGLFKLIDNASSIKSVFKDVVLVQDYYTGNCKELSPGACKADIAGSCNQSQCNCNINGNMENRDIVTLFVKSRDISSGTYSGVSSDVRAPHGFFFDWLEYNQGGADDLTPDIGDDVWSLHLNNPNGAPDDKSSFRTHLISEPGIRANDAQNDCGPTINQPPFTPTGCINTTLDIKQGSSGGAVYYHKSSSNYKVFGLNEAGPVGEDWGDTFTEDINIDPFGTHVQLLSEKIDDHLSSHDPGPAADPEWPIPSNPTDANGNPILPDDPSPALDTCLGPCDLNNMSSLTCTRVYSGSQAQSEDPALAVHGVGLGVYGAEGNDSGLGTIGLACQPWTNEPYPTRWSDIGGHSKFMTNSAKLVNSLERPLFKMLQRGYHVQNNEFKPIPMQLCPPGYAMYGLDVALETDAVSGEDFISGVTAIYCRSIVEEFDELGATDSARRINLGRRGLQAGVIDSEGRSLSQWVGAQDPDQAPATEKQIICDFTDKEIVGAIWIDDDINQPTRSFGLGCLEADELITW